jgi:hypothetical protein
MDQRILEGKTKRRKELAALSFIEKIRILEKLRDRSGKIAASGLKKAEQKLPNAGSERST